MPIEHTRRGVLAMGAGIVSAGLAGCVGSDGTAGTNSTGGKLSAQASFFVVGDFAKRVAGDVASTGTVVPIGQHGHGWEPGPDIQRDVLTADAFVFVTEGFQPWADDVIANIESDDADVAVIEAASGIDLIGAGAHGDEHADEEHEHETDGHGNESGHPGENGSARRGEGTHGNERHAHEGDGGEDQGQQDQSHDHDGGEMDPHFWLDPQRAKQAVENIRSGLVAADSADNANAYRRNAEAYTRRLDDLDARFAEALANAPKDHVFVAGHDAFGYLGARYGFDVHALTGLAPDDQPTPRDVAQAQAIIDEHDIEYVLAPHLESKRAATRLVAETSARGVLEVTSLPGTAETWEREGWGYVEIMANVNLPSFEKALGADS